MSNIYFDFEYNDTQVILCAAKVDQSDPLTFDLRENKDLDRLSAFIKEHESDIFISYALHAEITSLLRLGIDVTKMKCIDLMPECRMITMSHDSYYTMDSSLLGQVSKLLGKTVILDKIHKERMRNLILTQNKWTDTEWNSIVTYCISDLEDLRALLGKIVSIHFSSNHPITIDDMLARGEFVHCTCEMDYASDGFPVDEVAVENIFGNLSNTRDTIIFNLPQDWRSVFVRDNEGGWIRKRDKLESLVTEKGWQNWEMTESGKYLSTDTTYLKELERRIPEVKPFREAIQTLNTLKNIDLRNRMVNGYIKPRTSAFTSVTGRNGLEPSKGYILNLPKWLRKIIKPHPGKVFLSADWSQQEIAVGAALSGDSKLLDAYLTGDLYLAMGKLAGQIPPEGTKQTHGTERELFKALQLALGYGKKAKSLGKDLFPHMLKKDESTTEAMAHKKAIDLFNWHKNTFRQYWKWANSNVLSARRKHWIETNDKWVEWVSAKTRETQLLNFPMQSTGAVMMREATKEFYVLWKEGHIPPLLCSQHDGFYFNVDEAKHKDLEEIVKAVMEEVSTSVIGVKVRADVTSYGSFKEFIPKGWEDRHQKLWDISTKTKEF